MIIEFQQVNEKYYRQLCQSVIVSMKSELFSNVPNISRRNNFFNMNKSLFLEEPNELDIIFNEINLTTHVPVDPSRCPAHKCPDLMLTECPYFFLQIALS